MQLDGSVEFASDVDKVWDALHDPTILKNAIPGCKELILKENGEYDVVLQLGIAAVKGEYVGRVKLEDIEYPSYYVLTAEGTGTPGFVNVTMDCKLSPTNTGCRLEWVCNADIGGVIASVGNRILGGVAKFMAGKFFKDIQKQL